MKYTKIKGDLIELAAEGAFDVIAHQANCFHTMKSGVAKAIAENYPEAVKADIEKTVWGDYNKMGNFTRAYVKSFDDDEPGLGVILNIYSQYDYGRDKDVVYTDYVALRLALRKINLEFSGMHIGLPLIGCGTANGDWDIVKEIIQKELTKMNVTIVEYDK